MTNFADSYTVGVVPTKQTSELPVLPEGFVISEQGNVFYEPKPTNLGFARPWNIVEIDDEHRYFVLTPGQRREIKSEGGDRFFTPKFGKPGWNMRKTFPTHNAGAGIGFLMSVNGKLWRFTPRKELVRR